MIVILILMCSIFLKQWCRLELKEQMNICMYMYKHFYIFVNLHLTRHINSLLFLQMLLAENSPLLLHMWPPTLLYWWSHFHCINQVHLSVGKHSPVTSPYLHITIIPNCNKLQIYKYMIWSEGSSFIINQLYFNWQHDTLMS